jgi:hypothetical protein
MNAGAYSSVTACVSSARDYFEHVIVLVTYNHDRILNLIVLVTDLLMSSLYNHRALAVDGKGDFFETKFCISSECCWSQNMFNGHELHYQTRSCLVAKSGTKSRSVESHDEVLKALTQVEER